MRPPVSRSPARTLVAGADIGGTFTDLCLLDPKTGRSTSRKVLTTHRDPGEAVLAGFRAALAEEGLDPDRVAIVVHATTLATNALIERTGARTGMLTTRGFRDVIEVGYEQLYDLYDIHLDLPAPLVPRALRRPVAERTTGDGERLEGLDGESADAAIRFLVGRGVESIAVCFLHSYANPENERAAAGRVRALAPDVPVSVSSEVLPELGELPRFSTTVANAYVQPLVARYLVGLEGAAAGGRPPRRVHRRQLPGRHDEPRDGGAVPDPDAGIGAGRGRPRGGGALPAPPPAQPRVVRHGRHLGQDLPRPQPRAAGHGGVRGGAHRPVQAQERPSGTDPGGRPNRDRGRGREHRKDGQPRTSGGGAERAPAPSRGPPATGGGASEPTVTDAGAVLGYLNPEYFLGGRLGLDTRAAEAALDEHVGRPLGMPAIDAAWTVFRQVNEQMARAAAVHASEHGVDLRRFALLAFGGAGPIHAAHLARALGIRRVVVPPEPGVLSALGAVLAPPSFDLAASYRVELERLDVDRVNRLLAELESQGHALLDEVEAGLDAGERRRVVRRVVRQVDMRYRNQRYEVPVSLPPSGDLAREGLPAVEADFHRAYEQRYGRTIRGVDAETVTWRVSVSAPPPATLRFPPPRRRAAEPANGGPGDPAGRRPAWFGGGFVDTPFYRRASLPAGARLPGPAIVEEDGSTTVVPPGARATVDPAGNLVLEL